MDADLNKYDVHHRVVHHPRMSDKDSTTGTYRDAWRAYTRPGPIETVARRHGATKGGNPAEPARFMTMFKIMFEAEGIHPLEGGVLRMKLHAAPTAATACRSCRSASSSPAAASRRELEEDQDLRPPGLAGLADRPEGQERPQRLADYTDLALSRCSIEDLGELALFAETAGGEAGSATAAARTSRVLASPTPGTSGWPRRNRGSPGPLQRPRRTQSMSRR